MTFETFLWSWLKRRVHCRSLHIHVPSQRRACPDAEGKHGRLLKGGFIHRTKSSNLCPYQSAMRFACFVVFCVLIAPSTDGQQSHISSEKFTQQDGQASSSPPVGHRQKVVSLKQGLLLGQVVLTFKFKWCHGQAQASTVLVGPAGHILSMYLMDS